MMRKLGIIGAMKEEVALLQEKLERPAVTRRAGMDFWDGVLCGLPVTVVQSGIGKVNAALCVQVLADLYGVTHVVNTGGCRIPGSGAGHWRCGHFLRGDVS